MAKLSFLVRAGLGSFLTERPSWHCSLSSTPMPSEICAPKPAGSFLNLFIPNLAHPFFICNFGLFCCVSLWSGLEIGTVSLPYQFLNKEPFFFTFKESKWYNLTHINCLFIILKMILKSIKATVMLPSCSRAEWLLFAHFHICNLLILLLQTVTMIC